MDNGLLTGKYTKGRPVPEGTRIDLMPMERSAHWMSDVLLEVVEAIRIIADEAGQSMATLAFSWLASHRQVASVIAGASSPEQAATNAASVVTLSPEILRRLDAATASLATTP